MQKKCDLGHCGMKKIYYLYETKDGDSPHHYTEKPAGIVRKTP